MIGLGLGTIFIGYSLTYYGISQLRGGNWGLLDLVVPGRWAKAQSTPVDSSYTSAGDAGQSTGAGKAGASAAMTPSTRPARAQ